MTNQTLAPSVSWAQRKDKVFVNIQLEEILDEDISVDTTKLSFRGTSRGQKYAVDLEFFDQIVPEKSLQVKHGREFRFELKKKEEGPFWTRLLKDTVKRQNIKVDFSRWKDEDETDDEEGGMYDNASLEDMMTQMSTQNNFDPGEDDGESDSDDENLPELESTT